MFGDFGPWRGAAALSADTAGSASEMVECSLSQNEIVKELLNSVYICQSYHNKTPMCFYNSQCIKFDCTFS